MGRPKRHNQIKLGALKYDVATMDKKNLLTMYITCAISILFSNDIPAFRKVRDEINRTINNWLESQTVWNRKLKIFVFNLPNENRDYDGGFRNVDFELHLRRNERGKSYSENVDELLPLVDAITETIKKTCAETGLILAYRPPNKKNGVSIKEYVESLSANDSTAVASEPQSS